ncbi:adenylyl cyclase class-3/4/guanylyl cyclase [Fischerella thermalis CCMEE 5268]|uniref:Adenylyl cyclase class-3/4/guanylyl cyclase n=2 Tax=Fischerella TaxID=1190 RepID=A0A2N6KDM8_9CYAN|nr:adenylyl cyclase class-3/4/guanylyl cyclase [Fischerella thermalis CCMEE 5268]
MVLDRLRLQAQIMLIVGLTVIGLKKFAYDLWGDTVNTASKIESHGLAGCIQVCEASHQCLKDKFILEKRGLIQIKGKGEMMTYLLKGAIAN